MDTALFTSRGRYEVSFVSVWKMIATDDLLPVVVERQAAEAKEFELAHRVCRCCCLPVTLSVLREPAG